MYIVRALGATNDFVARLPQAKISLSRDQLVTASLAAEAQSGRISSKHVDDKLIDSWSDDPRGYDASNDCFHWGYRPAMPRIQGLRGASWNNFWICPPGAACPACPNPKAAKCPAPVKCPVCATVPPPGSALTPPGTSTTDDSGKLFGVNIGLLVAGAMTAGVGYYGYKKGWFKGLKRRR